MDLIEPFHEGLSVRAHLHHRDDRTQVLAQLRIAAVCGESLEQLVLGLAGGAFALDPLELVQHTRCDPLVDDVVGQLAEIPTQRLFCKIRLAESSFMGERSLPPRWASRDLTARCQAVRTTSSASRTEPVMRVCPASCACHSASVPGRTAGRLHRGLAAEKPGHGVHGSEF
jgi:hypothetical protein